MANVNSKIDWNKWYDIVEDSLRSVVYESVKKVNDALKVSVYRDEADDNVYSSELEIYSRTKYLIKELIAAIDEGVEEKSIDDVIEHEGYIWKECGIYKASLNMYTWKGVEPIAAAPTIFVTYWKDENYFEIKFTYSDQIF